MATSEQVAITLPRRGRPSAALVTARPLQWVKNALVVAAAGAAGALGHDDVPGRVALATVAFCMLSAGIYAFNDIRDAAEDRTHPSKRFRPVAAGELEPREAVVLGVGCVVAALSLCLAIRPLLVVVAGAYLLLTLSYTWLWRRIVVLDIVAIAGGFLLRALAGGVAAPVGLSRWFVLVVTFAAFFVAAGKRHAELLRTAKSGLRRRLRGGTRPRVRSVLRGYTPRGLQLMMAVSGAGTLFAYYVWAFNLRDLDDVTWRLLTAVPFTLGLLRYGSLVSAGAGEAPEETLLGDRALLALAAAWLALFALTVHATV